MTYDLRLAEWLPLRRRSGATEWRSIASIVSDMNGDPFVSVASPRPDFDGAVTEFLIGLLTAAFMVPAEPEWRSLWHTPPSESALQARLDALPPAFDLDGDGPRFLQDFSPEDLQKEAVEPIQELLLNAKNSGLFIKRETVKTMSRPAAAMALITLQAYSTAGGRGYRTSVRGGGPLTTIVDPRRHDQPEATLWHVLWANVETVQQLAQRGAADDVTIAAKVVFPWLARTRVSDPNGANTTPSDANALQAYFGMPRRVRIEFADRNGKCDVTGQSDERLATGFRGKSYGVNYEGWRHPLSPYYAGKQSNELLPVHGQPGGVGWRDWLSLLHASDAAPGKAPALTIAHFGASRAERVGMSVYAIRVFGYDASNAKIRAWIASTLPAFAPSDPERLAALMGTVQACVAATDSAAYVLQSAVADALHAGEAPGDLSYVKAAAWRVTEDWFYPAIDGLFGAADIESASRELKAGYKSVLGDRVLRLFDELAPSDATNPDVLRRVIRARFGLVVTLGGGGKIGEKIFTALGLVSPGETRRRKGVIDKPTKQGAR